MCLRHDRQLNERVRDELRVAERLCSGECFLQEVGAAIDRRSVRAYCPPAVHDEQPYERLARASAPSALEQVLDVRPYLIAAFERSPQQQEVGLELDPLRVAEHQRLGDRLRAPAQIQRCTEVPMLTGPLGGVAEP